MNSEIILLRVMSYYKIELVEIQANYFQKHRFTADIPFLDKVALGQSHSGVISDIHRVRTNT